MNQDSAFFHRLKAEIDRIPLVSTHEHTLSGEERARIKVDLFRLLVHVSLDLLSSGLDENPLELDIPAAEKWNRIQPYMQEVCTTGFFRIMRLAFQELFGFDEDSITGRNWESLNEKILERANRPGWVSHVLKERANIDKAILDTGRLDCDRSLFAPVLRFDNFIAAGNLLRSKENLQKEFSLSITRLRDVMEILERSLERLIEGGGVGIKSAYAAASRQISYEVTPEPEAARSLDWLLRAGDSYVPYDLRAKPFEDYMMHYLVRRAAEEDLPIQIHTGMQGGMFGVISNASPMHLQSLMIAHPQAQFDLFHGGFPYIRELIALAKAYPSVHVDFCWFVGVSPAMAKQSLSEAIDAVPAHKILAFGGDSSMAEGTYGAAILTRQIVTEVLAEKVASGAFGEALAVRLGWKLLRENARQLFALE